MVKIRLKIISGIAGISGIYKIDKITDDHDIDMTRCMAGDREYSVGELIKEENLHRLKIPGIMIIYGL